jgi:flagella basal body P-ring formation protein FlgA
VIVAATLMAAVSGAAVVVITAAPTVEVARREVRLSDVADLNKLHPSLRRRFGDRFIARISEGQSTVMVTRQELARLVRTSVPGLAPRAAPGSVIFSLTHSSHVAGNICSALTRPIKAGEAIAPADLTSIACQTRAKASILRFDRSDGVVRAASDLAAGTSLGRIVVPPPPLVQSGEHLTLMARSGPVSVQRPVTALQSGRDGQHIFVRDAEGQVSSVALDSNPETDR